MVIKPSAYIPTRSDLEALLEYGLLLFAITYVPQFAKEIRVIVEIVVVFIALLMTIRYFRLSQYFHSLLFTIIGALSALVFFVT